MGEQQSQLFRQRLGHDAEPQPPAGHGVGLGEAIGDDRAFGHAGQGDDAGGLALVHQAEVDLVGEDPEVAVAGRRGDVGERLLGKDAAGGVAGRVEDDHPRARAERGVEGLQVQVEAPFLRQGHGHGPGADQADGRLVAGEAGVGSDHLVARFEQGQHGQEDERLGSRGDDDLLWGEPHASPPAGVLGQGLAQGGDARRWIVAGLPRGDGPDARQGDVWVGLEVRLADLQVDDLPPLGLQRLSAGQHGVGSFGFQMCDTVSKRHSVASCRNLIFRTRIHADSTDSLFVRVQTLSYCEDVSPRVERTVR